MSEMKISEATVHEINSIEFACDIGECAGTSSHTLNIHHHAPEGEACGAGHDTIAVCDRHLAKFLQKKARCGHCGTMFPAKFVLPL